MTAGNCAICDEVCGSLVECAVCGMRKHPIGRDPGIAAANGYCGHDCPGYREEPRPGGLWPGERFGDSLGHMDWARDAMSRMSNGERVAAIRQSLRYVSHLVRIGEYDDALNILNNQVASLRRLCSPTVRPLNARDRRNIKRAVAHEDSEPAGRWPPVRLAPPRGDSQ